jgi:hypothetical protein
MQDLRAAEPAVVKGITYCILDDELASTAATLKLVLTDAASPHCGRELMVELPPPHHGHPEFVFLKCRFDAAINKGWKVGDRCQVCSHLINQSLSRNCPEKLSV